ncbi:hypothetical protein JCM10908_005975 [Rhodotorula pacifica]|uniref:uncharacterized protein n=1 Tax=Rhodotorula pacifica TaxID=1495444 RepID=UPI003177655C
MEWIAPDATHSLSLRSDPDLRAYVSVDGKPLEVAYQTTESFEAVKGFIPAEPGTEFKFGLYNGHRKPYDFELGVDFYLGERWVAGQYWDASDLEAGTAQPENHPSRFCEISCVKIGRDEFRTFCFEKPATTEKENVGSDKPSEIDARTTIRIVCYKVKTATCTPGTAGVEKDPQEGDSIVIDTHLSEHKCPVNPSFGPLQKDDYAQDEVVWDSAFLKLKQLDQDRVYPKLETDHSMVVEGITFIDMSPSEVLEDLREADKRRARDRAAEGSPTLSPKRIKREDSLNDSGNPRNRSSPNLHALAGSDSSEAHDAPSGSLRRIIADTIKEEVKELVKAEFSTLFGMKEEAAADKEGGRP